ncbi:hypothetical protein [Pyruvatibacter sp.]|uniref:hypothetical protein n=1 Tax=Pyruvatibacter sp. TaxID=1981328 RepID=UPI0032EE7356
MIRLLTSIAFATCLAAPAHALMVSAETALVCPEIADFAMVAAGKDVAECARVEKHMDLYGPVGRADAAPGGPFVRVRHNKRLYWAEASAFYMPNAGGVPLDETLAGARAPLPPAE